MSERKTPQKKTLRLIACASVLGAIIAGLAAQTDLGTLCAWCPIGFAQISLASRSFQPALATTLVAAGILAFIAGRGFCAWGCPSNLAKGEPRPTSRLEKIKTTRTKRASATSNMVIITAVLVASAAVGFPVFCLICPIGLVFGFVYAVFRSLTIYQPSWDLLLFPLMLLIEFRLLRSWCSRICPLGALFSLFALFSRFRLTPRVNKSACLAEKGCRSCVEACPEHLDMTHDARSDETCSLCMNCQQSCPTNALSAAFPHTQEERGGGRVQEKPEEA